MTFFASAPIAVFAAGALLLVEGVLALVSNWLAQTLALTHLGTLGFLVMVMMGALYQLTPVVAGSRVRGVRIAHAVHALLLIGLAGLVTGLLTYAPRVTFVSLAVLLLSLLLFLPPVFLALLRAPTRSETVTGMRMAIASLVLVGFLGLWMAHGHSGMRFPGPRAAVDPGPPQRGLPGMDRLSDQRRVLAGASDVLPGVAAEPREQARDAWAGGGGGAARRCWSSSWTWPA